MEKMRDEPWSEMGPEIEEETQEVEDEIVDALTTYFRRTSRGRIVDLPRWAI